MGPRGTRGYHHITNVLLISGSSGFSWDWSSCLLPTALCDVNTKSAKNSSPLLFFKLIFRICTRHCSWFPSALPKLTAFVFSKDPRMPNEKSHTNKQMYLEPKNPFTSANVMEGSCWAGIIPLKGVILDNQIGLRAPEPNTLNKLVQFFTRFQKKTAKTPSQPCKPSKTSQVHFLVMTTLAHKKVELMCTGKL